MLNLEERITRVWHQEVRPLVADAYRCHSTGTPRAAIVATWTAVCADIIHKLYQLAEDGDGTAAEVVKKIEAARSKADAEAVKTMQQVESKLLQNALDLELIDFIEHRQLERLQQDRHLCAHPSLRPLGDVFAPSGEYARAHLVAALDALLVHPPTQGRKAFDRYKAHVSDPSFVGHADYLVQMFAQRVKSSAWKQILGTAAKHAMLELEVPEEIGITASVAADRHALCLIAFAQHDRVAVREAVAKAMITFNGLPIEQQLKTIARLGAFDVFVDALDETVCQQIGTYVERRPALPADASGFLEPAMASVLALAGVDAVRARIPALGSKFAQLYPTQQAAVIERRPSAYFTDFLAPILTSAGGWRTAERLTAMTVIPCARLIQPEQLNGILTAWADNAQCREASGMTELAVTFWTHATQLRSHPAWTAFVKRVRELAADPQWFQYEELAAVIDYKDDTYAS
ncbi:hypothetical protein [Streptomyces diastatochromogenes]|uniref:Uncharacterized protein n=1 Tax=Streptomyces diastatochromogenes TaxID=42236 RepID=A0A233S880_STRDA|nr:hypothetical protein [Streptomyces diastatochromogenes]MCZ0990392.1 hypothetical protein [Streptomyces diastatochromogenes]OXY91886.1 hypothetical protein BEK98_27685 [Streptomyces diastatochromogenes]